MASIYDQLLNTSLQGEQTSTSQNNDPYEALLNTNLSTTNQPQGNTGWNNFLSMAEKVAQQRGFPPNVLTAQAALESARGQAAPGNNFFGIKGSGDSGSNNLATQEYGNGGYYGENSDFAAYKTPEDAVNAYLDLVLSYPGVADAVKTGNPDAVIRAIEANGYATSPTYVQDVENTPEFNQLPAVGGVN
jgi:flagellum-specific peptidoglycan hydrolase FlgJ